MKKATATLRFSSSNKEFGCGGNRSNAAACRPAHLHSTVRQHDEQAAAHAKCRTPCGVQQDCHCFSTFRSPSITFLKGFFFWLPPFLQFSTPLTAEAPEGVLRTRVRACRTARQRRWRSASCKVARVTPNLCSECSHTLFNQLILSI